MTDQTKAIEKAPVMTIGKYVRSNEIMERFVEVIGSKHYAAGYASEVVLACTSNDELMKCDWKSIVVSALRAAALRLDVDPSVGQAYLVPFQGKATLVIGYRGIKALALRTNQYTDINVHRIYKGEVVTEDRVTGKLTVTGSKESNEHIGWMLYFRLRNGYEHTFYMTVEEIDEHAHKFSKSINSPSSPWNKSRDIMEQKTVLRLGLSRHGILDSQAMQAMKDIDDEDFIDTDYKTVEDEIPSPENVTVEPDAPRRKPADIIKDFGLAEDEGEPKNAQPALFDQPTMKRDYAETVKIKGGKMLKELTDDELLEMHTIAFEKAADKSTPADQLETWQLRRDACAALVWYRQNEQ